MPWVALSFIFILLGILFFLIITLVLEATGVSDFFRDVKREQIKSNRPYKCECGIVSRKYQIMKDGRLKCPHCDTHLMEYSGSIKDDREFPFAPKLTFREQLSMERQKIKKRKEDIKLEKVKVKMEKLTEYDKELEAYEQLQMKKLKELEVKAEEIRAELAKKEVV